MLPLPSSRSLPQLLPRPATPLAPGGAVSPTPSVESLLSLPYPEFRVALHDPLYAALSTSPTAHPPIARSPTARSPTARSPTARSPTARSPTARSPRRSPSPQPPHAHPPLLRAQSMPGGAGRTASAAYSGSSASSSTTPNAGSSQTLDTPDAHDAHHHDAHHHDEHDDTCAAQTLAHAHNSTCGHEAVMHDNHVDYVVDGQLHHCHGNHCDWHGMVEPTFIDVNDVLAASLDVAGDISLITLRNASSAPPAVDSAMLTFSTGAAPVDWCQCPPADVHQQRQQQQPPKCDTCSKRKMRKVVPKLLTTTEDYDQEYGRFVKANYVRDFSTKSPLIVMKCVTMEQSLLIASHCRTHNIKCDSVRDAARLTDEQFHSIKYSAPLLVRTMGVIREAAQFLVNVETAAIKHQQRVKNANCCARFRQRKKEKLSQLEKTFQQQSQECDTLLERIRLLEDEREGLVRMATRVGVNPGLPPLAPLDLSAYAMPNDLDGA